MTTTKQELFSVIKSKAIVKDNELELLYQEKHNDFKVRGIPENKLEEFTLAYIKTYYKKQFISPAIKFKGVIIRDLGITDFGALRLYNETKQRFNSCSVEQKEEMIKQSLIDKEGNPLWFADNFKKGMQINPEKEKQRRLLLLAKKDNDIEYKVTQLSLRGDKLNLKRKMFAPLLFRANLRKEDEGMYYLNSASVTDFSETDEKIDVVALLKQNFSENLVRNLADLTQYHEANKMNVNRFCIVRANIANINLDTTYSNILSLDDDSIPIDKLITGFMNKDIDIDFVEGTIAAIVIGRTITRANKLQEEEIALAIEGVYVDDVWKKNQSIKPVIAEEIVEVEEW